MSPVGAEAPRERRMRLATLLMIVVAVLAGVILGLLVTIGSLDPDTRGVTAGAWRTVPRDGSGQADPYTLAANARAGLLPLGEAEGLSFIARIDDSGGALDGTCDYTLEGPMPPARFWTLSLLDLAGFPVEDPARRYGFTSAEVLRLDKTPVTIMVSPQARAGNWLPSGARRRFVLMLRLYDTSLTAGGTDFAKLRMPTLARGACS